MAHKQSAKVNTQGIKPTPWVTVTALLIAMLFAVLFTVLLTTTSYAQELKYYRVINDKGAIELKSSLTPAEAKRGYAVVTLGGHIIKEVPAELSDEEYALLSDQLKARERKAHQEKAAREYNQSLLLRYSTIDDLSAERKRKLAEFDVRIRILRGNMMSLKDQVERQQSRAANIERTGREVPAVIHNNILELEQKLNDADASLKSMQVEKEGVDQRYALDIQRFSQLIERTSQKTSHTQK